MQMLKQAAAEFLAGKRVAVTGVSRKSEGHGSNVVYQRLRQRGYQVFAVNPNAGHVQGDTCYHDLTSVPGIDWVVIGIRPQTVRPPSVSAPTSASHGLGCTAGPAREACHTQPPGTGASTASQ